MASWDRCAIYLKTNANATEKWLPLVRDGLIEFTPTLKRLDDSGAFVDAERGVVAPTVVGPSGHRLVSTPPKPTARKQCSGKITEIRANL